MTKRLDPDSIPLKFHKFVTYVFLPFLIIINVLTILVALKNVLAWNISDLTAINIFIRTLDSLYIVVLIIGLAEKKTYGWIMIVLYTTVLMLLSLLKIMSYWPDSLESYVVEIPLFVFMLSLVSYYVKRKMIFFNGSQKPSQTMERLNNDFSEMLSNHDAASKQFMIQENQSIEYDILKTTSNADANMLIEQLISKDSQIASLNNMIKSKNDNLAILQLKLTSLQEDVANLSLPAIEYEKAYFLDHEVVIISDDGSRLYHKYGCSRLNLLKYWIYDTETARAKGYRPCVYCNK